MTMYRHNRFNFGKYTGYTAEQVASFDPSYINWASRSMGIPFSDGVHRVKNRTYARRMHKPLYY